MYLVFSYHQRRQKISHLLNFSSACILTALTRLAFLVWCAQFFDAIAAVRKVEIKYLKLCKLQNNYELEMIDN